MLHTMGGKKKKSEGERENSNSQLPQTASFLKVGTVGRRQKKKTLEPAKFIFLQTLLALKNDKHELFDTCTKKQVN